jgi:hypothetical protein
MQRLNDLAGVSLYGRGARHLPVLHATVNRRV